MPMPDIPIGGGGPAPLPVTTLIEVIKDDTWIALGQSKPTRIYITTQGDWWDLIAIRVYGAQRGNEHLMYRLLEENWPLREVAQFAAGVSVVVPEVNIATDIELVPWKKASQVLP